MIQLMHDSAWTVVLHYDEMTACIVANWTKSRDNVDKKCAQNKKERHNDRVMLLYWLTRKKLQKTIVKISLDYGFSFKLAKVT